MKIDKFEFINRVLMHIPDKHFKIVRCYGIYSRRGYRTIQMAFDEEGELHVQKMTWRERIIQTFGHDPLKCPNCGSEMVFYEVCYNGTKEFPPDRPPPLGDNLSETAIPLSQSERIALILKTIVSLDDGEGVEVQRIIDVVAEKGIKEDVVISYLNRLKFNEGLIYECGDGRIRYAGRV